MAVIHFDKEHRMQVRDSVRDVHDKVLASGTTSSALIQVSISGCEEPVTVNADLVRAVTPSLPHS